MYLPTLVSPMSMPSLSNSPWMRGAPQSGLSRLIVRISFRISGDTAGCPGRPRRTCQFQNTRKPLRCQPITVSGAGQGASRIANRSKLCITKPANTPMLYPDPYRRSIPQGGRISHGRICAASALDTPPRPRYVGPALREKEMLEQHIIKLAVLLIAAGPLAAQETRGSLVGRVIDPTGAVLPDVKVEVI